MRLFIAVPLDENNVERVLSVSGELGKLGHGNFTKRENLHITMEFLGELPMQKIPTLQRIMDRIDSPCFDISIGQQLGCFGNLWWLSISSQPLLHLQSELHKALIADGFNVEARLYRPHLTLVREYRPDADFDRQSILKTHPPIIQHADRMILFASERINGRLTYTPMGTKSFRQK